MLVLDPILLTLAIMITRGSFRAMSLVAATRSKRSRRVLVYGAGAFGQLLVREMRANPHWQHEPGRLHRRRPGQGAPLDRRRAGARHHRRSGATSLRRYSVDEVVLSSPAINGSVEARIRDVCGQKDRPSAASRWRSSSEAAPHESRGSASLPQRLLAPLRGADIFYGHAKNVFRLR